MVRQFFLIIPLCIIASILNAQPDSLNHTDMNGHKQGRWKKNFENGKARYEGQFSNDKPVGEFRYYYDTGELNAIIRFSEIGDSSAAIYYHLNGKMMSQGKYIGQKKQGTWKYYDDREILSSEDNYISGKREGFAKVFYLDGKTAEEKYFVNDIEHGPAKKYFSEGKLQFEGIYVHGNLDGKTVDYYPSGNVKINCYYEDAVRDSIWIYYLDSGGVDTKVCYRKGIETCREKINGEYREYYPDTNIVKEEGYYRNGKKNGAFTEYYKTGELVMKELKDEEHWWLPEGEKIEQFEGQKVKTKGNYTDGKLDGGIIHFDMNGKISKKELYKLGKLIK